MGFSEIGVVLAMIRVGGLKMLIPGLNSKINLEFFLDKD